MAEVLWACVIAEKRTVSTALWVGLAAEAHRKTAEAIPHNPQLHAW